MASEQTVPRRVHAFLARCSTTASRTYAASAALSTALLVLAVPAAAVSTGVPVPWLLAAAAATYLLAVYAMDAAFEGVCSATLVVAVFNVGAFSVVEGHRVRVIDLLLGVSFCYLFARRRRDVVPELDSSRLLVVGAFGVFVLWTVLAGAVGNGPSSEAAFAYAQMQFRYGLLLAFAGLLVDETDVRAVLYPVVVALGGALVVAVDEVFSGAAGYPEHFGPLGIDIQRLWPTPSLTSFPLETSVLHAGPAVGQSRIMVGMALFFVPLVVAAVARSRIPAPLAGVGALGVVSVLASSSHAGILALYAVLAIVLVHWGYVVLGRYELYRARDALVPLAAVVGSVACVWVIAATLAGRDEILLIQTNNLDVRLDQYATAVDVAARYPLFGIGGGENFERLVGSRWGVHNLFLANLVATGVPGFLAYAISVATATVLAAGRLIRRPDEENWLWVGILAAMVGFYAYSFWTIAFQREPLNALYWILVGVVVGTSASADAGDATDASSPTQSSPE